MSPAVTKQQAKDHLVENYLRRHLLSARVGQPLPPVRSIMQDCSVSQATVQKIISQFESEGLVQSRPRKGIFKLDGQSMHTLIPTVDLIGCGRLKDLQTAETFTAELVQVFNLQATQRRQAIRLHNIWADQPISAYENLATSADVRGCILHAAKPDITRVFTERNAAWVSLYPAEVHDGPRIMNPQNLTALQMQHLLDLGHRRIAKLDRLNPKAPSITQLHRKSEYYRIMAENGLRVDPDWVIFDGYDEQPAWGALSRMFATDPAPTAVIVGDYSLPVTYRFLQSKGLTPGREVSVIATDDLPVASTVHPPATSTRIPLGNVARLALEMLEEVLHERLTEPVRYAPVKLIERESTGPAPKD